MEYHDAAKGSYTQILLDNILLINGVSTCSPEHTASTASERKKKKQNKNDTERIQGKGINGVIGLGETARRRREDYFGCT